MSFEMRAFGIDFRAAFIITFMNSPPFHGICFISFPTFSNRADICFLLKENRWRWLGPACIIVIFHYIFFFQMPSWRYNDCRRIISTITASSISAWRCLCNLVIIIICCNHSNYCCSFNVSIWIKLNDMRLRKTICRTRNLIASFTSASFFFEESSIELACLILRFLCSFLYRSRVRRTF